MLGEAALCRGFVPVKAMAGIAWCWPLTEVETPLTSGGHRPLESRVTLPLLNTPPSVLSEERLDANGLNLLVLGEGAGFFPP